MAMSRSLSATEFTRVPSMRISPSLTLSSPAIMARSVDLPQPDGPTSAMNSPVRASRSIPFSTSTGPNRLCSPEMVSVAIVARSFDRAVGQAANEIFAAEEIDQERRYGADQYGAAGDIVGMGIHLAGRERDQRCCDRRREGKDDLGEDAPEAGAVDAGRLDEVIRDIDVIVAAKERREGDALNHMHENEAIDGIGEAEVAEDVGPRQERDLAGHENAEEDADEQRLRSREAPLRENVAVDRAEQGRGDRRRNRHDQGIVEIAFDALAGSRDAIVRPRLRPGFERKAMGQRDQAVARDLGQFAKRIGDDDKQRQKVDEREKSE